MEIEKIKSTVPEEFRRARLHVAMQYYFVASDNRLQNRKKPDSDKAKFCDETVRRYKKSNDLCLMKNLQAIEGGKTAL
jgi:hypothetical protein